MSKEINPDLSIRPLANIKILKFVQTLLKVNIRLAEGQLPFWRLELGTSLNYWTNNYSL